MEAAGAGRATAQLRRGVLEHCVLALLRSEELYSLDLVRRLAEVSGQTVSEGTLYPLLTRLRKEGEVSTSWQESTSGPPRRHYSLTGEGAVALHVFTVEWKAFTRAVDGLLEVTSPPGATSGGEPHGPPATPSDTPSKTPSKTTTDIRRTP